MNIAELKQISRTGPVLDITNYTDHFIRSLVKLIRSTKRHGVMFETESSTSAAAWLLCIADANAFGTLSTDAQLECTFPEMAPNQLLGFRGQKAKYESIVTRLHRLLRQAKPWRGGCHDLKPLVATQRVRLPPGKGEAGQPEASLAWRAATPVVKRRQQVMKRRGKPRNRSIDDAFIVNRVGAAPGAPPMARRNGSSGVVGRRKVTGRVAREPGRSCSCPWARTLERGRPA